MKNEQHDNQNIAAVQALEQCVDQLLLLCNQLKEENALLRREQAHWLKERSALLEKSEIARTKVEAMVIRLKALEQQDA